MFDLATEIQNGYARGWSYTPLNGKRPILTAWQNQPRPTLTECLEWARRGNVGVRTGLASGVAVIDIDKPAVGHLNDLPATPTVKTGSGGYHLYYTASEPVANSVGKIKPHIDVRGDGGQVVAPGSIHPETNLAYGWLPDRSPHNTPFVPFPRDHAWIKATSKPDGPPDIVCTRPRQIGKGYAAKMLENAYDRVSKAPEGTRNDTLFRTAFDLGGSVGVGIVDYEATRQTLMAAGDACGLPRYETEITVERGLRDGMDRPKDMDKAMAFNVATPPRTTREFKGF